MKILPGGLMVFLALAGCSSPADPQAGSQPTSPGPAPAPGPSDPGGGMGECYDHCGGDSSGSGTSGGGTTTGSTDPAAQPVDPACMLGQADAQTAVLVPKWTPLPDTVPDDCLRGYEINNLKHNSYEVDSAAGSRAITLEVDIATYTAADHVRLVAYDASNHETVLIDTCRLRTATYADPTGGTERPPEDSIRDFRVAMPAGTRKLLLDNSDASTPTYVRVLGLCDFSLTPSTQVPAGHWRSLTSR